jgi:Fic family protein
MFVLDFLCVHPFNDGNGRMSRLLTLLLLYRTGYIAGKYISIEKLIENSKETYAEVYIEVQMDIILRLQEKYGNSGCVLIYFHNMI